MIMLCSETSIYSFLSTILELYPKSYTLKIITKFIMCAYLSQEKIIQ